MYDTSFSNENDGFDEEGNPRVTVMDCHCGCGQCAKGCACKATFDNMLIDELCACGEQNV